jgi:hypothetical protein
VAVDVAIHAPHREGDQRNHHAHVLTTTRALATEGFGAKTRLLDAKQTGGAEITAMREHWAGLQNEALARHEAAHALEDGALDRVDHRSLAAQRADALDRGDDLTAEELDRDPELKLGPAANAMERRAQAAAEREGHDYVPVTERGAVVHAARQARALFAELRERLEAAREAVRGTYDAEREAGHGRVSAGLAALRAAAAKDRERAVGLGTNDLRARLAGVLGREGPQDAIGEGQGREGGPGRTAERLREVLGRERGGVELGADIGADEDAARSVRERLDAVLNGSRTELSLDDADDVRREAARDEERTVHRESGHDEGLSH